MIRTQRHLPDAISAMKCDGVLLSLFKKRKKGSATQSLFHFWVTIDALQCSCRSVKFELNALKFIQPYVLPLQEI